MTSLAGATQDEVRRHNLARLLRLLHQRGPTSRSDLVTVTGLNRSTVGVLVSELVDAGLVRETAGVGRGVGRPSLVVEPVVDAAVVLAFDLRVERIVGALVGLGGTVFARVEVRHRRERYAQGSATRQLISIARDLLAAAPAGSHWVGTGVGVPGVVRHDDGLVRFAPNLGWQDVALGRSLSEALASAFGVSTPLVVGNDADLGAVAEQVRGAAVDTRNAIYLSSEVGVGGGIVLDGRLMTGAGGYGGEVGHMVVNPKGARCRCGSRGCWETEIGRDAVVLAAGLDPLADEIDDAVAVLASGDATAARRMDKVGRWLGIGLANLVNIVNPEVIVLGGHLREIYPYIQRTTLEGLSHALPAPREQVTLHTPALGGDSTLIGAAESAFAPLLDDPLGTLARSRAAAAS